MKHPALTRVFAVVLCIFALLMMIFAATGIIDAAGDRADAVRAHDLLSSRLQEYRELTEKLAEEGSSEKAQAELDRLETQYGKDKAAHQTALATYTATKGGLKQGQEAMAQANEMMSASNMVGMATQGIQTAMAEITEQMYALQDEAVNAYAYFDYNIQEENYEAAWAQLEASMQQLEDYGNYLQSRTDSTNVNGMLSSVNTLAAGIDAMNAGQEELDKLELQVIRDSIDLSLGKSQLEKQEADIADLQERVNEIRSDERRLVSLRVSMTANERIKQDYAHSENLVAAAENELARSEHEYQKTFLLRSTMSVLMTLAAAAAFIGMPAAFEKTKSRKLLVVPVVWFSLLSAATSALNILYEQRLHYLAFFAFLFGIIQLILVVPKEKDWTGEE